ncbi:MAG: DUF2807 domain-containing protein [Bacteroidales bacterium]|nr:DUF2807 domain-containing protein [Bacteroidales bacterium]
MKKLNLLALGIILISLVFTSCEKNFLYITGEGAVITKTLELPDISAVTNNDCFDVVIVQGDTQKIEVVGQSNIIDRLKTNVIGGKWNVSLLPGRYKNFDLTVYITVPDINSIKINGSGNIEVGGFYELSDLDIQISGSGNITVMDTIFAQNIDAEIQGSGSINFYAVADNIDTQIMGSGTIEVEGTTVTQSIRIDGSGNYKAFDLMSENATVRVSGSGDSKINVEKNLEVDIYGSGDVYYIGYPSIDINIAGSGSIISWN